VTTPPDPGPADLSTGELLRLTAIAERLGGLDTREAEHYEQVGRQLREMADSLAAIRGLASTVAEQSAILANLEGIDERLAALVRQYTSADSGDGDGESRVYRPGPPPPWWHMASDPALEQQVLALVEGTATAGHDGPAGDLAEHIRRLGNWVTTVYLPGYGHIAEGLAACWIHHPLCLYTLDWLCELWSVLYLNSRRTPATLAGQAEFQTRLLPAAAAQMEAETSDCGRHRTGAGQPGSTRVMPLEAPVT
jgi:hypothetical protein